jgi:MFS superfamily sulfate permease-like transporter
MTFIDSTAREMFANLIRELPKRGISLSIARLRDPVLWTLERAGIVDALGKSFFTKG